MPLIRTELAGLVGTIAFDNYAKRNALSAPLIAEFLAALDEFKREISSCPRPALRDHGEGLVRRP